MNGVPHVFFHELLSMLSESEGEGILSGPINGWGAMVDVKLQTLTCISRSKVKAKYLFQNDDNKDRSSVLTNVMSILATAEARCRKPFSLRARLTAPEWTSSGWSSSSPGFVFSFNKFHDRPMVRFGEDLIYQSGSDVATSVHMFAHRYAKREENFKDSLTWHNGLLLEWDHGRFTTLIELAWLNGLGGYKGKSNWYDDKSSESGTALYAAMPSEMKAPWNSMRNEIRILDVEATNVEEFKAYLHKYSEDGNLAQDEQRFLEPKFPIESEKVHLFRKTRADISRYILNYNRARGQYSEINSNCQTFAADFFRFLTGKPATVTTSLMRLAYTPHPDLFQQEPID